MTEQREPAVDDVLEQASKETLRLQHNMDITNADHIALWLEANTIPDEPMSQCISWLACRIVEAHEKALAALHPAEPAVDDVERMVRRLRAPDYWMSGSSEGHEGMNGAPVEAAAMLEALAALHPAKTVSAAGECEAVVEAAQFLVERLRDFDSNLTDDAAGREWFGHVSPAIARLNTALREHSAQGDR